jgi:transcriptional regulator with XRE-family HTH domain
MNLGPLIKKELNRRKITQSVLAEAIGMSVNAISLIINGDSIPNKSTIKKICDYLQVELIFTFTDTGSNKDEILIFRVTEEMKDELEKLAQASERTLSGYIRLILQDHIDFLK